MQPTIAQMVLRITLPGRTVFGGSPTAPEGALSTWVKASQP